jgi:hypothetical protein
MPANNSLIANASLRLHLEKVGTSRIADLRETYRELFTDAKKDIRLEIRHFSQAMGWRRSTKKQNRQECIKVFSWHSSVERIARY